MQQIRLFISDNKNPGLEKLAHLEKSGTLIGQSMNKINHKLEMMKKQAEVNAKRGLEDSFGIDLAQVMSYELDTEAGKFFNVDAPPEVIEILRKAGLLKEEP